MKKSVSKIGWEGAIVAVVEKSGGSATLKELYEGVPKIREVSPRLDANHIIRAYLRRMTRVSGKLKRIGLGMYALPDLTLGQTLFGAKEEKIRAETLKGVSQRDLHSHVEGMLLELGNVYGYQTYTADPSAIFTGKTLNKFATMDKVPDFTSPRLIDVANKIDVIWFKKRALVTVPKHTFDVEVTTDFSKALHRAYQLRDFKISFYVVSSIEKESQFKKRLTTDPYLGISNRMFFRSLEEVFSLYETAIKHSELKERIIVEEL